MRVAVTGATGLVGEFLIPHLLKHGLVVHALRRKGGRDNTKFEQNTNLHWFDGDLMDLKSLERLVVDCEAVVHAALEHQPGRYRGGEGDDPIRFRQVNLHQTEAFLKVLQETRVARTVFISSRAVFDGYRGPAAEISDRMPTRPESLYGEIKAQTEALGGSLSDIGFCSIRPTGIYGETRIPQDNKWWDLISRAGDMPSSDDSNQLRTEVHGEDVASAILLLLKAPLSSVERRHFNCSDIAVSRAQLVELCRQIKNEQELDFDALPPGVPPNNPMSCYGLADLGWQPGGMTKLQLTLRRMLAVIR